jgi:hypothetical protein
MTVRCIDCQLYSLREQAGMARQGFGRCALDIDRPGRFQGATYPRQCGRYAIAPAGDIEKRTAWLAAQGISVGLAGQMDRNGGQI